MTRERILPEHRLRLRRQAVEPFAHVRGARRQPIHRSSSITCRSVSELTLYGAFPVKRLFWGLLTFFVRSRKGRSSSRRLRSGSRSARKGSRDRNASAAWRLAALASLVFRSALTPEHAEGR